MPSTQDGVRLPRPYRRLKNATTAGQYRPPITGQIRGSPSRSRTMARAFHPEGSWLRRCAISRSDGKRPATERRPSRSLDCRTLARLCRRVSNVNPRCGEATSKELDITSPQNVASASADTLPCTRVQARICTYLARMAQRGSNVATSGSYLVGPFSQYHTMRPTGILQPTNTEPRVTLDDIEPRL